ncbi:hypothetical protein KUF71_000451 [Frankliniella fusca]|uniref:Uncharacterized protein n=1 Tax=Frankliniella fusca TaxID=407009 RepID=A0AAE1HRW5_9NEOP|nr:hypothetical protein KUF71_000451 [Frankliniella fusca]
MGYPNPTFCQVNRLLFSYYSVVKCMVQNLKYRYLISLHLAHYQEKSNCLKSEFQCLQTIGNPHPTFCQVNRLLFSHYSVVKYMVQNLKYQYLISLHLAHYQEKSNYRRCSGVIDGSIPIAENYP